MARRRSAQDRYSALIEEVFRRHYRKGATEIPWRRTDMEEAAASLGIELPKNLGDVVYSKRYRAEMPEWVRGKQPQGMEWIIEGCGKGQYVFRLVSASRIVPNPDLVTIKVPDATPEIIAANALSDEQALLAKVRYNRLVDTFLGVTCYSLQNHLRTTVRGVGQVETDEVYVGIDRHGRQYVIPVQAKGGTDQLSVVQTKQDIGCCAEKFPGLQCRAISTQFVSADLIAMFELAIEDGEVRIVDEKHYRLVPADDITPGDLNEYARRSPQ